MIMQYGYGMPIYVGGKYQRGHGLGNIFGSLFRTALPMLKSVGKKIGKQALTSGARFASDILGGDDVKTATKRRAKEGGLSFLRDIAGGSEPPRKKKKKSRGGPKKAQMGGSYYQIRQTTTRGRGNGRGRSRGKGSRGGQRGHSIIQNLNRVIKQRTKYTPRSRATGVQRRDIFSLE